MQAHHTTPPPCLPHTHKQSTNRRGCRADCQVGDGTTPLLSPPYPANGVWRWCHPHFHPCPPQMCETARDGGLHAPGHCVAPLHLHVGVPCKQGPCRDGNAPPFALLPCACKGAACVCPTPAGPTFCMPHMPSWDSTRGGGMQKVGCTGFVHTGLGSHSPPCRGNVWRVSLFQLRQKNVHRFL
jgi:hypothetical protein